MKLSISTTHRENLFGYIYLAFSQLLLPILIALVCYLLGYEISPAVLNIIYFGVNFVAIAAIFHRFLGQSLMAAIKNPWRCLRFAGLGFMLYYLGMLLVSFLILSVNPDFSNVNDNNIADMVQEHTKLLSFGTVFLVPVVEETLYRGLIFQQLQRKHRFLAYLVSCLVFSGVHVVGYIGKAHWLTLLLCFVQYLPAGISLAWAYEKSDTIFAPILMHITVNQLGIAALR